jgi:hypothetical protein
MSARDLDEVDRQIAEVRERIKEQKAVIHRLEQENETAGVTQAGVALRVIENRLSRLLERRAAVLGRLRRPRATSRPSSDKASPKTQRGKLHLNWTSR